MQLLVARAVEQLGSKLAQSVELLQGKVSSLEALVASQATAAQPQV
jgi:hypothetical protein